MHDGNLGQGATAGLFGITRDQGHLAVRPNSLPNLVSVAIVVTIIYLAQAVILPLAVAMLITFALSPLVTRLRKLGLPNLPAVLLAVATAFAIIGLFFLVLVSQLGNLAQNLPQFQANIITKVENLRAASSDIGVIGQLTDMMTAINDKISVVVPVEPASGGAAAPTAANPMPVEVVENKGPIGLLQDLVLPLISPIATTGLVIVVIIFMLLARDDLRDRFIRLVGSNDLHRTTQVLQDAGERVTQYLTVQLLVNVIYALPIGVGLWMIGVPNAALWGLVTLVMRFVPYIGTFIAAAFPLFLAFAVSPDWSAVLWTIALFLLVELITSNLVEPWLYGSRTGVSPLAIIISAIFWTWLWGPLGLVLSTPLTVCLVVMGRHIPQFAVFNIMFGDQPVLAAPATVPSAVSAAPAPASNVAAQPGLDAAVAQQRPTPRDRHDAVRLPRHLRTARRVPQAAVPGAVSPPTLPVGASHRRHHETRRTSRRDVHRRTHHPPQRRRPQQRRPAATGLHTRKAVSKISAKAGYRV